jgi:hypothetical protein
VCSPGIGADAVFVLPEPFRSCPRRAAAFYGRRNPRGRCLVRFIPAINRDAKPGPPRTDSPSLEERIQQAKDEIKTQAWDESKPEKPLDLPWL